LVGVDTVRLVLSAGRQSRLGVFRRVVWQRRSARSLIDRNDPLVRAIQEVLRADLREGARLMDATSRRKAVAAGTFELDVRNGVLEGYCAVGAAAYFHLKGGRAAGLQPMQRTDPDDDSRHWWIQRDDGRVVDVTVGRRERVRFPYAEGLPRGFTNAGYVRPPANARTVMDRVVAATGRHDWA
jgi:hypothetical protein